MPKRKFVNRAGRSWLQHVVLVAALLVPLLSNAVVRDYYFRELDNRQGLSQSSVTAMMVDRNGFGWIATQADLHHFDGYVFRPFHQLLGTRPLPSFPMSLAEDEQGNIYIGTLQDGLFVLNPGQHRLGRPALADDAPALPGGRIENMLFQPGTGLWFAWQDGISLLEVQTGHHRQVLEFGADPEIQAEGSLGRTVRSLAIDTDNILWVGTNHGLYRIDTGRFESEQAHARPVGALLTDSAGNLWMGTPAGLQRQLRHADTVEQVWPPTTQDDGDSCCETVTLAQADDGAIWLSLKDGHLWRYDPQTGDAQQIPVNPWIEGMLGETGIPHLMIDSSNLLWVGGNTRGVATTPADGTPFQAIFDMDPTRDPLTGNNIRAIHEDKNGDLWLGTLDGLRRYSVTQDRFDTFHDAFAAPTEKNETHHAATSPPAPISIQGDPSGSLWLASTQGLYQFDPNAGIAERVTLFDDAALEHLTAMTRLRDGSLWLGYSDRGLMRFNPLTGKGTPMPARPDTAGAHQQVRVNTIHEDSRGRVWVGGMLGLSLYDPVNASFRNFTHDAADPDSLSGNIVRAIHEARDGSIWIGSHNGLDQVVESTSGELRFRSHPIGEHGSGSGPVVYAIAEDAAGRLWLSGNHGIVQVDRLEDRLMHYGLEAGLQDLEFNGGAVATLRDGRIAFGGIRGLNLIRTDRVQPRAFNAPIALSWMRDGAPPVLGQIGDIEPIMFPQEDRVLRLSFAALDFTAPETNQYSYQLQGFDREFSAPSTQRRAIYTNLPVGRYLLRVRAGNQAGNWSEHELQVPMHVLPPWWRTWPAYVVYGLLILALIGLFARQQYKRVMQRRQLIAQIREREVRLKLSLWGAGDWFWDWDLPTNQLHRIGSGSVPDGPIDEQLGMRAWRHSLVHPDDLTNLQQQMQEHLSGNTEAYESEHRIRNAKGDWTWIRARGKVVKRDADGNPLRVAGTARDISASRQAERDRRIASEVLRSMNEAVAVVDLNFRFVSVNPAFSRITGYEEKDVVGMSNSLLDSTRHPPEFYQQAHDALRRNGHFRGEMWLRHANGEEFLSWIEQSEVRDEAGVRTHFVAVVNDITDKKRIEQELRYLANYDTLTGLPNRTLLSERLARTVVRARRQNTRVAVLFLDLDHFKLINDSLGHAAGDRILKAAAVRLQTVTSSSDTVARLGGDEFTIIMEDVTDLGNVAAMAEAVIAAFGEPILNDDHGDVIISPSIGISLYPDHAKAPTDLLKFADAAMYRAKERGRNTFQFYDEFMDAEVQRRASMTAALRRALDRNEFTLAFQPRQSLFDGRINGVEVLLRWTSQEFGVVPPGVFIPLAEETGLILPIGKWVLERACEVLREWIDKGIDQVRISVNVSVLQLLRDNLPFTVQQVLENTRVPAARLELELTESMVMANAEQAITVLRELKQLGISIAIDDFGTGYSSLIYLKRLPIDTLKIDKEFVGDLTHDPDDEAIVTTIISMAHSLGLAVVAEGVETPEQLRYLRGQGCDEIQGYLLAHPMPADECLDFLRQHAERHQRMPLA